MASFLRVHSGQVKHFPSPVVYHLSIECLDARRKNRVCTIADPVKADPITTTLYSLIATIRDIVGGGDDRLVVATAVYILRAHRATFLGDLDASTLLQAE